MANYPKQEMLDQNTWVMDQWIDLNATPDEVWPWLAQLGNGRAGWYSYDWIDNLGKKSLSVIDPEMVAIQKGQKIPFFVIADFTLNEFITFEYSPKVTFTYYLEPMSQGTRLWSRVRVSRASWLLKKTLGPAHKFMQDKQFLEIKKRVEKPHVRPAPVHSSSK